MEKIKVAFDPKWRDFFAMLIWNLIAWPLFIVFGISNGSEGFLVLFFVSFFVAIGFSLIFDYIKKAFNRFKYRDSQIYIKRSIVCGTNSIEINFDLPSVSIGSNLLKEKRVFLAFYRIKRNSDGVDEQLKWFGDQNVLLIDAGKSAFGTCQYMLPVNACSGFVSEHSKIKYEWRIVIINKNKEEELVIPINLGLNSDNKIEIDRYWDDRIDLEIDVFTKKQALRIIIKFLAFTLLIALCGWWFLPQVNAQYKLVNAGRGVEQQSAIAPEDASPPTPEQQLLLAVKTDNVSMAEQILRSGGSPNWTDHEGLSALMLAAYYGHIEMVDLLLRQGADPDLRQTVRDRDRGDTALLKALYLGHLDIAKRLVQAGASLDVKNRWDWGPVHMAAQAGCVPCLDWLKERGLQLNEPAPASRGETPLMLSATRGRVEALQWFYAQGIDLWQKDDYGYDALGWARWGKQVKTEQWLMNHQPE